MTDGAGPRDETSTEFTPLTIVGSDRLQREIDYNPTRFRQMVADYGGVGAARRLLRGPDASDGFTTLWEARRLDLSVEAHVLLPRFADLFTEQERQRARQRREEYCFHVEDSCRGSRTGVREWRTTGVARRAPRP